MDASKATLAETVPIALTTAVASAHAGSVVAGIVATDAVVAIALVAGVSVDVIVKFL